MAALLLREGTLQAEAEETQEEEEEEEEEEEAQEEAQEEAREEAPNYWELNLETSPEIVSMSIAS